MKNNFERTLEVLQEGKASNAVKATDVKSYLGDTVSVSRTKTNCFKVVELTKDRGLGKKLKSIFKAYPQIEEIEFSSKDSSGEVKKETLKGGK